ncbi:hypothetical protein BGZ76_000733 [Entomortierella beljakovae]|nr:hypothetical protein BGZ76_000733 [Entomortierella beljakovae]
METGKTTIGTEESKTCDLVADLLTNVGWNTFPFSVSRDPAYKFDIGLATEVKSMPSYVAEKKGGLVLIVDEDRCIKDTNRIMQWGEYRLAGEMLVCGLAGNKLEGDISLYGMRVIGTRFTFCHTVITEKYYLDLGNINREKMEIKRFPTFGNEETLDSGSLDYKNPDQGKVIVDALARMAYVFRGC